uniref:Uncharacterized protein n=1 Tax=Anguilla anguilla TaxID=7936 RepID=A0A0E9VPI9_ANGAN
MQPERFSALLTHNKLHVSVSKDSEPKEFLHKLLRATSKSHAENFLLLIFN